MFVQHHDKEFFYNYRQGTDQTVIEHATEPQDKCKVLKQHDPDQGVTPDGYLKDV